jgi:ribosome-binding ATPase YchF (GTP1/OBG family)
VPDPRLEVLAGIFGSERILPATVTFVDIAGIVKGASEGAGLGNKFLANIRECDAICQVLRAFHDDDVVHVEGRVSPAEDMETINTELILADLQTLEKAIPRLQKEARNDKSKAPMVVAVEEAQRILNEGTTLFGARFDTEPIRELFLLTAKPFLYVINADEEQLADEEFRSQMTALVAPAEAVFLDAKIEAELGNPTKAAEWRALADQVRQTVIDKLWVPERNAAGRAGTLDLGTGDLFEPETICHEARKDLLPEEGTRHEVAEVERADFRAIEPRFADCSVGGTDGERFNADIGMLPEGGRTNSGDEHFTHWISPHREPRAGRAVPS